MRPEKISFIVAVCLVGVGGLLVKLSSQEKGGVPELPQPTETGALLMEKGPTLFDEGTLKKVLSRTGRNPWSQVERLLHPTPADIPAPPPPPQPPPFMLPPLAAGGPPSILPPQKLNSIKVLDSPKETPPDKKEEKDANR